MNAEAAGAERLRLLALLKQALDALEAGDEPAYRARLDDVVSRHPQPVLTSLARLAFELNQALGAIDSRVDPSLADLPDASARLEHVVKMTEEASHRTLDLAEECRSLVDEIQSHPLPAEANEAARRLRANLSEIALAQGYQDLTGQVIRRVMDVVARVQAVLSGLPASGSDPSRPTLAEGGPALDGLDSHGSSQGDADELLARLGL